MAGYFYNDGKVREASLAEILTKARTEATLALVGPGERRQLEASATRLRLRGEGPRANVLLEVGGN
jgi:hypothetical protein